MVRTDPDATQLMMDEQMERARARAGQACPLLDRAQGLCTVYDARPTACRNHMNLYDDALLYGLDAGENIPLPLFDGRRLKALLFSAQPASVVADIRAFFPDVPYVANLPV